MATFVLIHGAWHGGWCWEEIVPRLEAKGHRALAPDLPGMAADRTPLDANVLGQWTTASSELVGAQAEPVVLVGHSRGGLLVSTVAEHLPGMVAKAVYLAAPMLMDGQTGLEAQFITEEALGAFRPNECGSAVAIDPSRAGTLLYGRCTPEVSARATARLVEEPLQPFDVRLSLSAERYGRVPRAYIETTDDKIVSLAKQRAAQANWPCETVVTLPSDHCPFYSMPNRLAQALDGLTKHAPPE